MRGIVLAGGKGSRLHPLTLSVNKHLLPVHDKPMIYYPLATLMAAGIREILIIVNAADLENYKLLLGDGSSLGIAIDYVIQQEPSGIVDAFILGKEFIGNEKIALVLGDNIFHGSGLGRQLESFANCEGANIFAYRVSNPQDYGVVELNENSQVLDLVEKPQNPKSNFAVPGLYFFDASVVEHAPLVEKSIRGELEIISLLKIFLSRNSLNVEILPRGTAWLDTGTPEALMDAGNFVRIIEERQGYKIACLEEISWRMGWISDESLLSLANQHLNSKYAEYLRNLVGSSVSKEW